MPANAMDGHLPRHGMVATAYYGVNRQPLLRIKAQYDAENLFRSPGT